MLGKERCGESFGRRKAIVHWPSLGKLLLLLLLLLLLYIFVV
jgi:hypothetical protein